MSSNTIDAIFDADDRVSRTQVELPRLVFLAGIFAGVVGDLIIGASMGYSMKTCIFAVAVGGISLIAEIIFTATVYANRKKKKEEEKHGKNTIAGTTSQKNDGTKTE